MKLILFTITLLVVDGLPINLELIKNCPILVVAQNLSQQLITIYNFPFLIGNTNFFLLIFIIDRQLMSMICCSCKSVIIGSAMEAA